MCQLQKFPKKNSDVVALGRCALPESNGKANPVIAGSRFFGRCRSLGGNQLGKPNPGDTKKNRGRQDCKAVLFSSRKEWCDEYLQ